MGINGLWPVALVLMVWESTAIAIEPPSPDSLTEPMEIVTPAFQLRDLEPDHWAFEALKTLIDRYHCITGYPDHLWRGANPLSRYELAASLKQCLMTIEAKFAENTANFATRADLELLQKLTEEFTEELKVLDGRVNELEPQVSFLERHQFSTTTKLSGEVIFAVFGGDGEGPIINFRRGNNFFADAQIRSSDINSNISAGSRIRLNLDTSFGGFDRLRARLQIPNSPAFSTFSRTIMGEFAFSPPAFTSASQNVDLDTLEYRFFINEQMRVILSASGRLTDFADPVNDYFNSEGGGALSRFAQYNPIYRAGAGAGIGLNYQISDNLRFDIGYLGGGVSDSNPEASSDFWRGAYGTVAQLTWRVSPRLRVALGYVHSYNFDTGVGSNRSNPRTTLANFRRLVNLESLNNLLTQIVTGTLNNNLRNQANIQAAQFGIPTATINNIANQFPSGLNTSVGSVASQVGLSANFVDRVLSPLPVSVLLPNLPASIGSQTVSQVLQSAGFSGPISSLTPNNALNLNIANIPGIQQAVSPQVLQQLQGQVALASGLLGLTSPEATVNVSTLDRLLRNYPIVSNAYGFQFLWDVTPRFAISGWVGYTNIRSLQAIAIPGLGQIPRGDMKNVNVALGFAFPDLGKSGNLGGFLAGIEPITIGGVLGADVGVGMHFELFYKYQINDNLSITPGLMWLTAPDHDLRGSDLWIGLIRTTWKF